MHKVCPTCRKRYVGLEVFCTKCGVRLEDEPNRCSEEKTALCKRRIFEPDDIYCCYCGSLTTYAKEKHEAEKK